MAALKKKEWKVNLTAQSQTSLNNAHIQCQIFLNNLTNL